MLQKTILIMAGGTGGHVFPALALATALREQGFKIAWLGTALSLEAQLVAEAKIPFYCIKIKGLRGKSWRHKLALPYQLLRSSWQALRYIRQLQPALIVGFGGYASAPGGVAAWLSKTPLIIHEQNAKAGLTNRLLGKIADQVLQAFPNSFASNYQALTVGNPVRRELIGHESPRKRYSPHAPCRLLVLGGSLGAAAINTLVPAALACLPATLRPDVWHQTGSQHLQTCLTHYQALNLINSSPTAASIKLCPFIEDMRAAYLWADLVICRAGALTVAELATVGVASILIPFPHAVDDHQTYNANSLAASGAALLCQQAILNPEKLADLMQTYFMNPEKLVTMAEQAYKLGNARATAMIVQVCLALINNTRTDS